MKKIISLFLMALLIIPVKGYADAIYEERTEKPLSKGVTYIHVRTLDENGWNNYNLLKADLKNDNLSLKVLANKDTSKKSTVEQFVSAASGIIGGVNGDFFTSYQDGAACEGMTIKDGELITTPSNDKAYATLVIPEDGNIFSAYFGFSAWVKSKRTGDSSQCLFYNKLASEEYLKIYDSNFGRKSPGSMDDGYEVLVEDGIVTGVFSNKEGIEIPENGYVLHNSLRHSLFLAQNFEIGDEVEIKVSATPSIDGIAQAIGGGTVLLSGGKKASFTLKDSRQPMTAIGINKNENIVYLLTADGRLDKSRGLTFSETADYLAALGCTEAMSFDGGGSTAMVINDPGKGISHVNMQTYQRPVINAIGIENSGKGSGVFSYLDVFSDRETLRVGEQVSVYAVSYDEYMQPADITGTQLSYSADKKGHFANNVFTPEEAGRFTVTVTANGISGTVSFNVKEAPVNENYKDVYFRSPSSEGYTIGFFGDNGNYGTLYTKFITSKRNSIAEKTNLAVFRQYPSGKINTEVLSSSLYSAKETAAGAFICLNNSKGSYSASDSGQLVKLINFLKNSLSENVFIAMSNPFGKTDSEENEIIIQKIKEISKGKNIFVISFGDNISYKYDDGVRYITINDLPNFTSKDPYNAVNNSKYGLLTINNDGINFEFKSYFGE